MSRFVFKLDPLLRARRRLEQGRQRVVAELEQDRARLEDRLRRQQELLAQGRESQRAGLVGRLRIEELRIHAGSSLGQMRQAERLVLELAGLHRRLETARQELVDAARHRRAIELLRDRRYEQWRAALDRAETARLDELAVIAAARKDELS